MVKEIKIPFFYTKSDCGYALYKCRLIKRSFSAGNMLDDDNILSGRKSSLGTTQNNEETLPEIYSASGSSFQRSDFFP